MLMVISAHPCLFVNTQGGGSTCEGRGHYAVARKDKAD